MHAVCVNLTKYLLVNIHYVCNSCHAYYIIPNNISLRNLVSVWGHSTQTRNLYMKEKLNY